MVTWSHMRNKNVRTLLLQDLWPPNLAGWLLRLMEINPSSHATLRWGYFMITLSFWFRSLVLLTLSLHSAKFGGHIFFIFARDVIWWLCDFIGSDCPTISHQPFKFGGLMFCRSRDIKFLICHGMSRDGSVVDFMWVPLTLGHVYVCVFYQFLLKVHG